MGVINMNEKRFYSLDSFYKNKFGCKVFKVSLDAGFTCPNKDGSKGVDGCIFCNGATGVGNVSDELSVQYETVKKNISKKWPNAKCIPFLEANTNTYGPLEKIKEIYEEILTFDDVVGLDIATRCDAITEEVYDYLEDLNKRTYLTIELGLQSSHDTTLAFLNRGHTRDEFTACVKELKKRGIDVVVHIINGLPNETEDMMLDTIRYVNQLQPQGIKFHMLYIERGTRLCRIYEKRPFSLLTRDEYIKILCKQLAILDERIVIHRLVSDPNAKKLVEPKWLTKKFEILNDIDRYLCDYDIVQGCSEFN